MIDALKKTLLAGVGAAVVTKEKVEASLNDLVKQGKVSAADARSLAEKIAEDGRKEFEAASSALSAQIDRLLHKKDETVNARIAGLEARVAALEAKAAPPSP